MIIFKTALPRLRYLLTTGLAVLALLTSAQQVHARNQYLGNWQGLYPASTTDNTAGRNGCQVCHGSSNGVVNGYGRAIGQLLNFNQVGNASAEIAAVEGGDGDGQGDTNITEITANSGERGQNPLLGLPRLGVKGSEPFTGSTSFCMAYFAIELLPYLLPEAVISERRARLA